jgi:hypothetical protein
MGRFCQTMQRGRQDAGLTPELDCSAARPSGVTSPTKSRWLVAVALAALEFSYLLRRELAAAGPIRRGKNLYDLTFDVPPPPDAVRWSTDRS